MELEAELYGYYEDLAGDDVPPAVASAYEIDDDGEWERDLTEDGDVESHPGTLWKKHEGMMVRWDQFQVLPGRHHHSAREV